MSSWHYLIPCLLHLGWDVRKYSGCRSETNTARASLPGGGGVVLFALVEGFCGGLPQSQAQDRQP